MICSMHTYKNKFKLLSINLKENNFDHFPNMNDHLQQYPDYNFDQENYVAEINNVIEDFDVRLCDFKQIEDIVQYMSFPFQ